MSEVERMLERRWGFAMELELEAPGLLVLVQSLGALGILDPDRVALWRGRLERALAGVPGRPAPDRAVADRCEAHLAAIGRRPGDTTAEQSHAARFFADAGLLPFARFRALEDALNPAPEQDTAAIALGAVASVPHDPTAAVDVAWIARRGPYLLFWLHAPLPLGFDALRLERADGSDITGASGSLSNRGGTILFPSAPPPGERVVLHVGPNRRALRVP